MSSISPDLPAGVGSAHQSKYNSENEEEAARRQSWLM